MRGIFVENSVVSPFVRFSAQTLGVKCGRNRLDVHAPTGEKTTMNNYVIIRLDKLNSTASIRRSLKHAFREQDTPNADPARLSDNSRFFADDVAHAMQNIKMRWPQKIRKNGVRLVEFVVTGSPEAINAKSREEQDAYFSDALKYIQDKHGAENVVCAGIHRDETTPHMYIYAVPIDDKGKLNCNGFYGKRSSMSDLQTDFAKKVGEPHGLRRGEPKSKAKHTTIKEYYTRVNAIENMTVDSTNIEMPEPGGLMESKKSYGERVFYSLTDQFTEQLKNTNAKLKQTNIKQEDKISQLSREVQKLVVKNTFLESMTSNLQQSHDSYKNAYESQKHIAAARLDDIQELKNTVSMFTPSEIEQAKLRKQRKDKEAAEQLELKNRQAAVDAAKAAAMAAEIQAQQDKQAAEDKANAKADADADKAAREELRLLRAELYEREPKKMSDLDINRETHSGTWGERLAFLKSKAQEWEKPAQTPMQRINEEHKKQENEEKRDYDSPSPF